MPNRLCVTYLCYFVIELQLYLVDLLSIEPAVGALGGYFLKGCALFGGNDVGFFHFKYKSWYIINNLNKDQTEDGHGKQQNQRVRALQADADDAITNIN